MSSRICFIGNSHLAAIRLGFQEERFSGYRSDVSMFGSYRKTLFTLRNRDGRIVSDDAAVRESLQFTGGAEYIDPSAYDMFCIVACGTNVQPATTVIEKYTSFAFDLPGRQLVSQQLLDKMLVELYRQSLAEHVIAVIRAASQKPIYLIADPLWAPWALDAPRGKLLGEIIKAGLARPFVDWTHRALAAAFKDTATIVVQPPETVQDDIFTIAGYSKGSVRLRKEIVEHEDDDYQHMNAEFGALMLDRFFAGIKEAEAA